MTIPVSKDELSSWSPDSFANLVPRPTFRLRPATPRSRRDYNYAIKAEGLRFWPLEVVRKEHLRALDELWSGDEATLSSNKMRLEAYWATTDAAAKDATIEIDPNETDAVAELSMTLSDHWPPIRRMNFDNYRFNDEAPKIAIGLYLAGWSGIDVPFKLQSGSVPIETVNDLENEISRLEEQAIENKVEGVVGTGFAELAVHCLNLMSPDREAEKNWSSPSQSSDDLNGSMMDGTAEKAAKGKSAHTPSQPETIPETT